MNGHCSTCPVEPQCGYEHKPCDCRDRLKFKPKATEQPDQPSPFDVPTMGHVARRKLAALVADGHEVCGVMIRRQNADGTVTRGAVSAGGMVIWWHPEQAAVVRQEPAQIGQGVPAAWQPIEVAPRDGTEILLMSDKGRVANGMWVAVNSAKGYWAWPYVNLEPAKWTQLPLLCKPPRQPLLASDIAMLYDENPRSDSEMIASAPPAPQASVVQKEATYTAADVTAAHTEGYKLGMLQVTVEQQKPLTDERTKALLFDHAIGKGLLTVHSERMNSHDPATRCSWLEGHAKACDISNEAAHSIVVGRPTIQRLPADDTEGGCIA